MGSAILADPAMLKISRILNGNIYFAIFRRNRESLDLLRTVPGDNIFCMRDSGLLALAADSVRFFFWTRRNNIDTVIDLELFSRFTAILAGFSGATRTVGFHAFYNEGLYRGDFLTHKVSYNPHQHIAKNFIALVNAVLSDKPEIPYSKTVIADDEISIRKVEAGRAAANALELKVKGLYQSYDPKRHKLVLFNTHSSDLMPLRRWPQNNYIRLAKMVLDEYQDVMILLTGDPSERQQKDDILSAVSNDRCLNFAGQTTIGELPALYGISSLMLTNDSGPAHFASVTNMPVFVLFGPETPDLYGPLGSCVIPIYAGMACSPCVSAANHRKSACNDNVCLQIIAVEQVFRLIKPKLDAV